jgi:hypothetical protein
MAIPIWRFGTRWINLKDYSFHPDANVAIAEPSERNARRRSWLLAQDAASTTLIGANLTVLIALVTFLHVDKKTLFLDLIRWADNFSIICYMVILMFFSIYLGMYYRVIWSRYFGLNEERPNDTNYFLHYAFFLACFSIVSMFLYPLAWPLYIVIIFIPLGFKKFRTMTLFCSAVDDYLSKTNVTNNIAELINNPNPHSIHTWICQLVSARQLSVSFTRNFIFWGLLFGICSGFVVRYADDTPQTGWTVGTHQLLSIALVVSLVFFFLLKTSGGGIRSIRNQIESGEWNGFTLLRPFWK